MKLGMISLGCAKNLIDTELFLGVAKRYNLKITNDMNEADILVVNTCGFISSAKQEAIDTILELTDYQAKGKKVVVMGCLVERYQKDLEESIPEVDFYFPIRDYKNINELFKKLTNKKEDHFFDYNQRVLTTLPHSAYVRIADGCDNKCAYCAIPLIRGPLKSRTMESIKEEVMTLCKEGVVEITLIAQDTTRYGYDLHDGSNITVLIQELSKIDALKSIRLLYLYPDEITDELLNEFKNNKKLASYFDIPIQHASNKILKAMNRRGSKELIRERINKIREMIPDVVIRTTILVGFPTETEEDFKELYDFVGEMKFDRLGVFTFSKEEGTAAVLLSPRVKENIAKQRRHRIMHLQSEITKKKNQKLVGKVFDAVVDNFDFDASMYRARTYAFAPDDVDGCVFISSKTPLICGETYKVVIKKAHKYDLIADVINE